jgi:Domain of unknown function (DUF4396)
MDAGFGPGRNAASVVLAAFSSTCGSRQSLAIVPMRGLSPGAGIAAALKADTLSLISCQVGMSGFMAPAQSAILPALGAPRAEVNTVEFWFVMQLAMAAGFITAYPVNWRVVAAGIQERM